MITSTIDVRGEDDPFNSPRVLHHLHGMHTQIFGRLPDSLLMMFLVLHRPLQLGSRYVQVS
jgi:hypothetical protein